ncbi:hypothetical protein CPT_Percy16 [Caulobacter phage Percy]|uniref:Uncharacterized protein n=1 Tax=Caulobacter phage Percy TaxID=1701809 RepID=A0A0M4S5P9_9CAUD|nr:hypothetical protein CPT_Percy16 [Caulobacter phage Percy]ALF01650.1 hypothetical protein CPT_Percy16 [Caulobacter phage Percy]
MLGWVIASIAAVLLILFLVDRFWVSREEWELYYR